MPITDLKCPFIGSKISDWTVWDRRRQAQEYSQCAHPQPQKGGWTVVTMLYVQDCISTTNKIGCTTIFILNYLCL